MERQADRPLFSQMLAERRLQLGLSIKQASNVLRFKEEVLIAFEEGDFDAIPKSGYAQGMLSSYARYLGLNAKTVVNQFATDLFEHERGAGSHEARRRSRRNRDSDDGPLYETPQASVGRPQRPYVESRGFLPTSGGFAGDMADFATTSAARPRYSSASRAENSEDQYPQGRPYTSRVPLSTPTTTPLVQSQRQRPSSMGSYYGQGDYYGTAGRQGSSYYDFRDEVTTRRVAPSQYRDDMRLDNTGSSYQSASTSAGRRSSRNIASTQRPNVQRRSSQSRARSRGQRESSPGVAGILEAFFADRSRMLALVIGVLCLFLTAIIIFSVRSCVQTQAPSNHSVTVTSTESTEQKESQDTTVSAEEEQRAREEAAAAKAAETETNVAERTFEVTVADRDITWLEIEYDGNSDIAETVTGPWNRTYTVRQAISIRVNDPSVVTVTENGKKLEFDSKASGIGMITVQVSKSGSQAGEEESTDGETEDENGQHSDSNGDSQDESGSQQGSSSDENPFPGYDLAEDGLYYGPDGYYDAYGNFYQY